MISIVEYPRVVETPCVPVVPPFGELAGTCLEMIRFIQDRSGLGLAAPQIGDFRTYFVVNYGPKPLIVINPSVTLLIEGRVTNQEGCYSSLGKMYEVKRARKIQATWFDLLGKRQSAILKGDLAIIFQHEYQHCQNSCIAQTGKEVKK